MTGLYLKHRGSHTWVACCVLPGEKEILALTKQAIFRPGNYPSNRDFEKFEPNLRQSSNPDSSKNDISTSDKTKATTGENEKIKPAMIDRFFLSHELPPKQVVIQKPHVVSLCTLTETLTHARSHIHTRTQTRTHVHTHTRTHAHTHTRTHAHRSMHHLSHSETHLMCLFVYARHTEMERITFICSVLQNKLYTVCK